MAVLNVPDSVNTLIINCDNCEQVNNLVLGIRRNGNDDDDRDDSDDDFDGNGPYDGNGDPYNGNNNNGRFIGDPFADNESNNGDNNFYNGNTNNYSGGNACSLNYSGDIITYTDEPMHAIKKQKILPYKSLNIYNNNNNKKNQMIHKCTHKHHPKSSRAGHHKNKSLSYINDNNKSIGKNYQKNMKQYKNNLSELFTYISKESNGSFITIKELKQSMKIINTKYVKLEEIISINDIQNNKMDLQMFLDTFTQDNIKPLDIININEQVEITLKTMHILNGQRKKRKKKFQRKKYKNNKHTEKDEKKSKYAKFSGKQLKELCTKNHLNHSGTKPAMIKRLEDLDNGKDVKLKQEKKVIEGEHYCAIKDSENKQDGYLCYECGKWIAGKRAMERHYLLIHVNNGTPWDKEAIFGCPTCYNVKFGNSEDAMACCN